MSKTSLTITVEVEVIVEVEYEPREDATRDEPGSPPELVSYEINEYALVEAVKKELEKDMVQEALDAADADGDLE